MSHGKRVTRDNRESLEYRAVTAKRKLRTDTKCPAGKSRTNHVKNEQHIGSEKTYGSQNTEQLNIMMQRTANENAACLRRICKICDLPKIERLVNNDARLILRRKLNGATTRYSTNWKPNCNCFSCVHNRLRWSLKSCLYQTSKETNKEKAKKKLITTEFCDINQQLSSFEPKSSVFKIYGDDQIVSFHLTSS